MMQVAEMYFQKYIKVNTVIMLTCHNVPELDQNQKTFA